MFLAHWPISLSSARQSMTQNSPALLTNVGNVVIIVKKPGFMHLCKKVGWEMNVDLHSTICNALLGKFKVYLMNIHVEKESQQETLNVNLFKPC